MKYKGSLLIMKNLYFFCLFGSLVILMAACASEEEGPIEEINIEIEVSQKVIFNGESVQFRDKSTGSPTSWLWEFPGGTPDQSTERNPVITYNTPGIYSILLVASNESTEKVQRISGLIEVLNINVPPYAGTVWFEPNIITDQDPTLFKSIERMGMEIRSMYDKRQEAWIELNAHIFEASFDGGKMIEILVNPEFTVGPATEHATTYAQYIGQLPGVLMEELHYLYIHDGNENFGGGSNAIDMYVGQGASAIESGHIEELLLHEAAHVSLQELHNDADWIAHRTKDPTYISTYARDHPRREDVAESIVPYIAIRFRKERISDDMHYVISKIMPNRIQFFDDQGYDFSIYQ